MGSKDGWVGQLSTAGAAAVVLLLSLLLSPAIWAQVLALAVPWGPLPCWVLSARLGQLLAMDAAAPVYST